MKRVRQGQPRCAQQSSSTGAPHLVARLGDAFRRSLSGLVEAALAPVKRAPHTAPAEPPSAANHHQQPEAQSVLVGVHTPLLHIQTGRERSLRSFDHSSRRRTVSQSSIANRTAMNLGTHIATAVSGRLSPPSRIGGSFVAERRSSSPRKHWALILPVMVHAAVLLAVSVGSAWATTTYYSQGSVDPTVNTNWNSIRAGGGSTPANFTSGDVFVIQNGHSMGTTPAWSVSGTGAKIQIESGGTLTANSIVSVPTFQVDDGGTYIHNTVGSVSNGSSADFPGTTRSLGSASTVQILKWANNGTAPAALPSV